MTSPLRHLAINDDVEAEFSFWKSHFLLSAWMAAGFALVGGTLIAIWPQDAGSAELRGFVQRVWPLFVEFAFWLGFLLGLLWGAARRLGCGLSGTLPWQPRQQMSKGTATARLFGHWASGLALAGLFLWIAARLAQLVPPGDDGPAFFLAALQPLAQASFWCAALFAAATLALRLRAASSGRAVPGRDD